MPEGVLPQKTERALDLFAEETWLQEEGWYMAGGTALALQCGHRESVDLDFFTQRASFNEQVLAAKLLSKGMQIDILEAGTLYGSLEGAKVIFIAYPFFIPREAYHLYGAVPILDVHDIGVMKIVALSQRGKKRDFVDLYWYANNIEPLSAPIGRFKEQYPQVAHDYHHLMKAFVYFEDAEYEPMPQLHFDATWEEVKAYFLKETPMLTKQVLRLT